MRNGGKQLNFCGDVAVTMRTRNFCVSEISDPENVAHAHAAPWLIFALCGKFADLDGDVWRACDSSSVIVHPAEITHLSRFNGDARAVIVEGSSAEAVRAIEALANRGRLFQDVRLRLLFLRIWSELYDRDEATQLALDGAIFMLLAELVRMATAAAGSRLRLAEQLEALLDTKGEGEIVSRLAASNQMSARTCMRRFRLETGLSVAQYVAQLRAERAKTLLRTTSLSVLKIAEVLGYYDRSHFARAFSRSVGMTPLQYRNSIV